ncbi:MAG TPA: MFS transporter, partial [Polyangiaceae bacterium]|nr:MFS transporter [Polyangiaceae bacterium]
REFLQRDQAWLLLSIVLLYKFGDVVVGQLRTPFLRSVGFTLTEIGTMGKLVGIAATIVGALVGGGFVAKWSLKRAMIAFGIAQALPNLTYAALAYTGKNYVLMAAGYGIDNFMGGMGTAALIAFLMTLCDKRYTAMQYALFTALMTVPGRLFGLGSGWLVTQVGWPALWVISVVVAVPALLLLARARLPEPEPEPAPTEF